VTVENPFEAFDLDPLAGPEAITDRLRELAEEASTEERARIREAWQALTLHPLRRLQAALGAHPETRALLGAPPAPPRWEAALGEVTLLDLLILPSVEAALGPGDVETSDVPLELDPICAGAPK
jgi:hypothetical protein